jgi:hypothetical protein
MSKENETQRLSKEQEDELIGQKGPSQVEDEDWPELGVPACNLDGTCESCQ